MPDLERNLGEQPIATLMRDRGLKPHDLVAQAPEPITHKMVARACKGRRLNRHVQIKVLNAFNRAAGATCALPELFNY